MTRFWIAFGVAVLGALVASAMLGGPKGLEGMALGIAGSAFNIWALWSVIRLSGKMIDTERLRNRGTFIIVLAFFVKLPLFLAMGMLAQSIGAPAQTCFLLGLALVYSALVGWALARG
ncbi:MAG: hypothetical protein QOJ65_2785 [Fimbriimonadaceae bacterium]|jgi:hypothetical protein|nr:hypothetical protein [Fimbriimonadaceae bacterium]